MSAFEQSIDGNNNQQIAGNVYNITTPVAKGALKTLIDKIVDECHQDHELCGFISELQDYINVNPRRSIIGLENKLNSSGRSSFIDNAITLKDRFSRKLYKNQLSISVQTIYIHVLAYISKMFRHKIRPLLIAKVSDTELHNAIYSEIVDHIFDQIASPTVGLTIEDIEGMLYFLSGQCHLDWSNE
ncbi:MAG: hypothetical protein P4L44_10830 [Oryzomonas sp.]|uniref:ABC-three component system protein n=1 Tax=Oryzomonas sp. TaxID=2855186 RepID=UPI0028431D1E|nr:ABC-three component system protein [Oryzomonas sp.]MDR3580446.1 hypothetical protein [Oryzomonas sp.]